MEKNKSVSLYIRVSSEEQVKEGYSLEAQKKKLEEYAEFKKWKIFKVYQDAGISAKSIKGRKAFVELLNDAKNGKFSAILIYKFDRAFRNVKEALITLDELKSIGVDFISITEEIDTTSAMGKFFFTIISGFAELERNLTKDRLNLIHAKKFEDGRMVGKSPLGYKWSKTKKIMLIDEKKAEIIRDVFNMTLEGKGYKKICEKHKLSHQSYYNIIRNPVYVGLIEFKGEIRQGKHEPIISKEMFEKINLKTS